MTDTLDLEPQTKLASALAAHDTETPSDGVEFTETQARAFLDKFEGERPSIRALGELWGWHRSRVERFLKRLEQAGVEDFGKRFPASTAEEAVASGVVSQAPKAETTVDDDHGEPLFRRQGDLYVHMNNYGELVLLEKRWPDEDQFICIARHNVYLLTERIQQVVAKWDEDQR